MLVHWLVQNKIKLLALLSFLTITCITFFKNALELEDAEQAYYSQWLRWGYDDQPPLYTWLQYGVNQIFGVQKVSFAMLRGVIFSAILLSLADLSKRIISNRKKSELAVLLVVLLPVFVDFTFRRLSHTSLLCLSVIVTLISICRLLEKKTVLNYIILGCIFSIGVLSKYNYVLFLTALLGTAFFDKRLRKVVLNPKFLLTIGLSLLLLFPHFYWLVGADGYLNELKASIALKTESTEVVSTYVITPVFSSLLTLFKFKVILLGTILLAFVFNKVSFKRFPKDWFTKLAFVQALVLLLFFIVMNVNKVEERWLLPLFLPFVILLVRSVSFISVLKWHRYLSVIFICVIIAQTVRTPIEKIAHIPSDVHFGFEPLSNTLNTTFSKQNWILPNVTYGGNIRLLNPQKEIFSRDDFSLPASKYRNLNTIEVRIGGESLGEVAPVEQLLNFGMERDTLYFMK